MHIDDIDEEKNPRRSNARNSNDGVAKVRAKTELQTKTARLTTSRNAKDSNKFVPKVGITARSPAQVWISREVN